MKPSLITARALRLEGSRIEAHPDGGSHVVVSLRLQRFWLPFFAAEVTPWWWAKPLVFVWACWSFWVLRR